MGVEDKLLVVISRVDTFCSDYWWIIMGLTISLLAIVAMLITIRYDNKHIK